MAQSKILIVEDDPDQAALLDRFLSQWGYQTKIAPDGPEALEFMESFDPDLVLLDIFLPQLPGLEVLKKIRAHDKSVSVPVFIMSADDSDEIRIVGMSTGASDFIKKPIQLADLSMRIQQALELLSYRRKIHELNQRLEHDKQRLLRYFSRDIVEKILSEEISSELGGKTLEASVMFYDVRGSTTIAERIGPQKYAEFISDLFGRIMDLIFDHQGSVNELLGDGILATFGCPDPTGRDAANAVEAARAIRKLMKTYNEKYLPPELQEDGVRYGMGIATGKIFAGNIGSYQRLKYAVMGDPVNTAARIQDLTKEKNVDLLIDEATALGLDNSESLTLSGDYMLRGKKGAVKVFEVNPVTQPLSN
ncbi:MAG TPA: guanylate cyclase [Leptospiraceae bacterium]|nr:guanylate cyclase [Spirochaetaceae bacterium]HBS06329.1 guanylate cyclase [Leptospiraceae bacterium]|tara:strand:- start:16623 stop:17711 length:1089 start_codon:yes stop_codon:yes gene_type:complete